ncbi:MAG: putative selenate reductase subunit YgfK [Alkalispirochaetaceae bacterium]
MGDTMRLLPLGELIDRMLEEYRQSGGIFDLPEESWYRKKDARTVEVFGESCETPLGPAAGPHTQLAQNIVSSYLAGSRFIELKTVQILDALEIEKPCIDAADEGYNTEWSTELTLEEAWEEYAKGWVLLHLLEELFDLKVSDGDRSFIFNMSVGYDLKGITTEPMQRFISRMKDSSSEEKFQRWVEEARGSAEKLAGTGLERKAEAVRSLEVPGEICTTMTLSTMHGCPPAEIESICEHMLIEQKLDTFVKLNPTLLGYEFVRETLDGLGFDYVTLSHESFDHDLHYPDAIAILTRLRKLAEREGRRFGVKLSNTLPTVNDQDALPGEEMYLSGRTLYPLTINLAAQLSEEFRGELPISYSGGITIHNVREVFRTGIRPLTLATDLLKPGGYLRMVQLAEALEAEESWDSRRIDVAALRELAEKARNEKTVKKSFRGTHAVHNPGTLPLFDCYVAPCVTACPIGQHVPEYIRLVAEKRYADALEIIYERNALPSITGHICDHQCQLVCTRLDYEGCLNIREVKKLAVLNGMDEYKERLVARGELPAAGTGRRVAVVGAGPAGLSSAYFLAREGFSVTVLEREPNAGGVVSNVVPHFRISREAIESDIDMIRKLGVEFRFGVGAHVDIDALRSQGYEYIVLALGTYQSRPLPLEGDNPNVRPAYPFLIDFNRNPEKLELGKRVVVVGAGDTAMDCARAALRSPGVEEVIVAYRRAEAQMPASEEEYELAREDGIAFHWLRNPERFDRDGTLTLRVMELGEPDDSGRRRPLPTEKTETITADTLIHSIGDDPEVEVLAEAGLNPDRRRGTVKTGPGGETEVENVFLVGDSRTGASTIVNCIAEGRRAAETICRKADPEWSRAERIPTMNPETRAEEILAKKGEILAKPDPRVEYDEVSFAETEGHRCLECNYICNKCVDVCPNRANIAVPLSALSAVDPSLAGSGAALVAEPYGGPDLPPGPAPNRYQIIHLDAYCNECGNCGHFCPWEGRPYTDKPTIFSTAEDFEASENPGWLVADGSVRIRFDGGEKTLALEGGRLVGVDAQPAGDPSGGPEPESRETDNLSEERFYRLFEALYATRPHLFGPVEPTRRKPARAEEA